MSTTSNPSDRNRSLQERIDLLVDGELDEQERASLVAELESDPQGWRQCALTFLENQMIQHGLRAELSVPASSRQVTTPVGTGHWFRSASKVTAIAAALIFAFILGSTVDMPGTRPPLPIVPPTRELAQAGEQEAARLFATARPSLFQFSSAEGLPRYSTREDLPPFILTALVEAGHRVEQSERIIQLPTPDGDSMDLPVRETHIVDTRPRTL